MFYGIDDKVKHNTILFIPSKEELQDVDNKLIDPSIIHPDLINFVHYDVPNAYITPGKVQDIPVDQYERLLAQTEDLKREIKENKDVQIKEEEKLRRQLEEFERNKQRQLDEDM